MRPEANSILGAFNGNGGSKTPLLIEAVDKQHGATTFYLAGGIALIKNTKAI
jgi:hypothetical protein